MPHSKDRIPTTHSGSTPRSASTRMAWPVLGNFLTETWTWGYSGSDYFDIDNWWLDNTKAPLA